MASISISVIKLANKNLSELTLEDLKTLMSSFIASLPKEGHFLMLNGIISRENYLSMFFKAYMLKLIDDTTFLWGLSRYQYFKDIDSFLENDEFIQSFINNVSEFTF